MRRRHCRLAVKKIQKLLVPPQFELVPLVAVDLLRVCPSNYQHKALFFVAKVKNGFTNSKRDRIFTSLKTLSSPKCPFTNLPEDKAARWGESLTAEKMKECRWVKTQADLPRRFRRMD
jgi:hypothetical protein